MGCVRISKSRTGRSYWRSLADGIKKSRIAEGTAAPLFLRTPTEQPQQERQENTQQEAGHEGEVEAEIAAAVMNVSRQAAEPAFAGAGPKQQTHQGDCQSHQHQNLA